METSKEKIKEHYDRVQKIYNIFWLNKKNLGMHYGFWEKNIKNLHEAIIAENKTIAEILNINKNDKILDAGCGVGGTSIWIAENYGSNVIGITLSEKQAKFATEEANKRKINNLVEFFVRDFCDTGFQNDYFDKVVAVESVCHAEKKEYFIKEAYRILKLKGKVLVADFFIADNLNDEGRKLIDEWCKGWEMPNLSTFNEFKNKLELSGFKNIQYFDKTKEILPSSQKMYFKIGKFLGAIFKLTEIFKIKKSHGGTKAVVSQYCAFKKGFVKYYLFLADKI